MHRPLHRPLLTTRITLTRMVSSLPFADITVPVPGYGAMGLSQGHDIPKDPEVSKAVLRRAVELGCTFWDTASGYGCGHNESLIGEFIKEEGCRDKLFIASKCGHDIDFAAKKRTGKLDNSAHHIKTYIEGTIERLGTIPDLYYLHRIEPGRDLNESIGALSAIKKAGRCKYIGISECSAETLRKACAIAHIDALQIEYSPWTTDHERNGLIETAKELGVAVIAYSPLGSGLLTGAIQKWSDFDPTDIRRNQPRFSEENLAKNLKLVDEFKKIAAEKGCTPGQLSLAWVAARGAIPIPGTKSIKYLEANFAAKDVELTKEELATLRKVIDEARPVGERYTPEIMKNIGH